jgi:hypothetical protein
MAWLFTELQAWRKLLAKLLPGMRSGLPPERQRALDLLAAIDAGGVPLNAARVNDIARQLGLDVSTKAPMVETIARIRRCAGEWR